MSLETPEGPPTLPIGPPPPHALPWTRWVIIGWIALVGLAFVLSSSVVVGIFAGLATARGERADPSALSSRGDILAIATCAASFVTVALTALFVWLGKDSGAKERL